LGKGSASLWVSASPLEELALSGAKWGQGDVFSTSEECPQVDGSISDRTKNIPEANQQRNNFS
jgi:hypothetical protein